jgi:hypothetical protein
MPPWRLPPSRLEAVKRSLPLSVEPRRVKVPTPPPPPPRGVTIDIPLGASRDPLVPTPPPPASRFVHVVEGVTPEAVRLAATDDALATRIADRIAASHDGVTPGLVQLHETRAKVASRLAELQLRAAGMAQEHAVRARAAVAASSSSVGDSSGGSNEASGSSAGGAQGVNWQWTAHGWKVRTRGRRSDFSHRAARASDPVVQARRAEWDRLRAGQVDDLEL